MSGMLDRAITPNRIPWPPLLFIAAAIIAIALHWFWPLAWPEGGLRLFLAMAGFALVIGAVALDVWAMRAFRRHRTTVMPHRGATALIEDGPFRYSRNPIYVGNTLAVFGAGLLFGVAWLIPAAFAGAIATHHLAILREEKHLAAKFGGAWAAYAARTPRWMGLR